MGPWQGDAMSRVHLVAKSDIREGDGWAKVSGMGSVKSDNATTERELSYDFGGCVDRNTEMAYDRHVMGRKK